MCKFTIRNRTPVSTSSLCFSCIHSLILFGYLEREAIVLCTAALDNPISVPFNVRECSRFTDRNCPPVSVAKAVGFTVSTAKSVEAPAAGTDSDE